jgi:hypothetical protein
MARASLAVEVPGHRIGLLELVAEAAVQMDE